MIESHNIAQILEGLVRLVLGELVDAFGKDSIDEQALPASDRVGADNWMNGGEARAFVEGVTANARVGFNTFSGCYLVERAAVVSRRESFEELLIGR